MDAERNLFSAELNAANLRGKLFQALVDIYKAMGGGWVVEAQAQTARAGETAQKLHGVSE